MMPPSSSRQVQSWFVVSFVNKGDVEVGTRRQSGGLGLRGRIRSRRAKRSQCQHDIVAAVKQAVFRVAQADLDPIVVQLSHVPSNNSEIRDEAKA